MPLYVLLTTFLFQRGPAESQDPDGREPVDEDPRDAVQQLGTQWLVKRGGGALALYQHSLTLALLSLFALCFVLHAARGAPE